MGGLRLKDELHDVEKIRRRYDIIFINTLRILGRRNIKMTG